jgi:hypothetical protein
MDIVWHAVKDTVFLLWRVLPVMFAGLFGVEVIVRLGLMKKLASMIIQLLVHTGALNAFEVLITPAAKILRLPTAVIAPVRVYIVSPIVGIGAMSALLQQHLVTEYQAIVALVDSLTRYPAPLRLYPGMGFSLLFLSKYLLIEADKRLTRFG